MTQISRFTEEVVSVAERVTGDEGESAAELDVLLADAATDHGIEVS